MDESQIGALVKAFETRILSEAAEPIQAELVDDVELKEEEDIEMQFSMTDFHRKKLFIALARKHGLRPYRYPRQKHTTVMLKGKRTFFDTVLWPQFTTLSEDLNFLLQQITNEVIRSVLHGDTSDVPYAKSGQSGTT
ncbi:MAG: hypothetical protein HOI66_06465 [Verrucomicrobia bacterium]|jgi:hypothetical protein|nr:hypothetical protein [Verrucomicrobiota bacterium]MDA7645729.1 hypothetical protein [bacterium]